MAATHKVPITHVIWDVDGTLLDTESVYTKVTNKLLEPYGLKFPMSVKAKMMGRPARIAAEILIKETGAPMSVDDYLAKRERMQTEMWPHVDAMPGAQELVECFHKNGVKQGVATSSTMGVLTVKTTRHKEWFRHFATIVTGDDAELKNGKPHPDIFLLAAKRMGVPQDAESLSHVLVFEDAANGVEAAKRAGMRVVAIPEKWQNMDDFKQADVLLGSLREFDGSRWGLPSAPKVQHQ